MRKISNTIRGLILTPLILLVLAAPTFAQRPFNKAEFEGRRARLFEKISDGIAVIFGAKGQHYPVRFRQSPDFYYLTGIEEPSAVLVLLGPTKAAFLFAPKRTEPQIRADGPGIWQVEKREEVYGLTRVQPIEEFLSMLPFWAPRAKKLYMLSGSQGNVQNAREELDYYELLEISQSGFGGVPESAKATGVIRQILPQLDFAPLDPLLDEMRWVKSAYEIEAAARYIYTKRGARGDAFRPIVASGPNTMILHYSANNRQMMDGEVVYMDYGADYEYYNSDITRT